ncbi:MAG: LysM peptidoglycan-binding domain-containing protein [Dehalococcoidia bacterium]|nr:LysM peptidoglycan-binding domain-containing protein [Dehalococcoidia bacterium]
MNTQKQILLIVVLFFTFVGGCAAYSVIDLPVRAKDQTEWHHSQSVERGALLFANNCRTCHGIKGQGGVGPVLNKADFQNQDPLVLKNNITLLQRTISCGRAGTLMPAWLNTNGGSLNALQIEHLVKLITDPVDINHKDEDGNPTSQGWVEAVEFGHNLNAATAVVVGGDTLDTIAKDHQVGIIEVGKLNNIADYNQELAKNTVVKLPPSNQFPDGRSYTVKKDRETVAKIAQNEHVGAMIIADLNGLNYHLDTKTASFTLLNADAQGKVKGAIGRGDPIPGVFPGTPLALPAGATYAVQTDDTLQSIADEHSIPVASIQTPQNEKVLTPTDPTVTSVATDTPLSGQRVLKLPENVSVVVQPGMTIGTIATQHAIKPEDVAAANPGLDVATPVGAGQVLKLPAGVHYLVQEGDTLANVAKIHQMEPAALAQLNGIAADAPIGPLVIINLPKVDRYLAQGQTLDEVAKTYSNVTKESLAEANGISDPDLLVRIGQTLKLPADAWGSAPPTSVNSGTACVQYAVPTSVYNGEKPLQVNPNATPVATLTPPATQSKDVTIQAHANDWTVVADGQTSAPNKGVVAVAKGTGVKFDNLTGLHTITVGGKKDDGDFKQGDQRTITFSDAGTFKITCDYHPDMLADVFVQ